MGLNIPDLLTKIALGAAYAGAAGEIVMEAEADVTQLKAGQTVSVTVPSVGGSIQGVPVRFSASIVVTPVSHPSTTIPPAATPSGAAGGAPG